MVAGIAQASAAAGNRLVGNDLDAAGFELAVNGVELELVEVQLLADIVQLRLRHAAALVGSVRTLTAEFAHKDGIVLRIEFRRDVSDQPFFLKNTDSHVSDQSTLTVGALYAFGAKIH